MRKLFVLLLIALVPLSIGCRLTENDDAGPDITALQPADNLKLEAKVPVNVNVDGSVRQNVAGLEVKIAGEKLDYVETKDGYHYFSKTINLETTTNDALLAILESGKLSGEVELVVTYQGITSRFDITISIAPTSGNAAVNTTEITPSYTTDGKLTITVSVGGTTPLKNTQTNVSLGILKVEYLKGTTYTPLQGAVDVPVTNGTTATTTFRITFNAAVASITENFQIRANGPTGEVILDQDDITAGNIKVTPGESSVVVELLKTTVDGKVFKANTKYTLTYVSSSVCLKSNTSVKFPTNFAYSVSFKTAQ